MRKTFSDNYIQQNKALHESPRGFGGGGANRLEVVLPLIQQFDLKTMLDYGAGQNLLKKALQQFSTINVSAYDPAIPGIDEKPAEGTTFDLVTCTDVLEHIEPEYLDAVLDELYSYTGKFCFLLIACTEANKTLPDGRNAHLIQQPPAWWDEKLSRFSWEVHDFYLQMDKYKPNTVKKYFITLGKI